MFIPVVFSLVAIAAAVPGGITQRGQPRIHLNEHQTIQHDQLQQQELGDLNTSPLREMSPLTARSLNFDYAQPIIPITTKSMGGSHDIRQGRFYPYSEEFKENYPFLSYNYKNIMGSPAKENYFLRFLNTPDVRVAQPKIDYDSRNYFHQHDVNHHHIVNNIHDFKQKHVVRKLDQDIDSPYLPYSPMYYNKFNRGYPYENNQYSRSLEQGLDQPWINNHFSRFWDLEYMKNYYGNMNYEVPRPVMNRNWDKPYLYKSLDDEYVQPATSESLMEVENVYPATSKSLKLNSAQPLIPSDSYPVISKGLKFNYAHPIIPSESRIMFDQGSLGYEHVQPATSESLDVENVYPVTQKSLKFNYAQQIIPSDSRIKRDQGIQAGANAGLDKQNPIITKHHPIAASHEQDPVEGRKQDIQLNTNVNKQAADPQSEDHISQQPIHRQTRDVAGLIDKQYPYDKFHNRFWDLEYVNNYDGNSNYEVASPFTYRNLDKQQSRTVYKGLDDEYEQPTTSESLYLKHFYPVTSKSLKFNYAQPIIPSDSYPATSRSLKFNYAQPIVSSDSYPVTSKSINYNYAHPVIDSDSYPATSRSLKFNYA